MNTFQEKSFSQCTSPQERWHASKSKAINSTNKEHLSNEFIAKWSTSFSENEEYGEKLINIFGCSYSSCSSSSSLRSRSLPSGSMTESFTSSNGFFDSREISASPPIPPKTKDQKSQSQTKIPQQSTKIPDPRESAASTDDIDIHSRAQSKPIQAPRGGIISRLKQSLTSRLASGFVGHTSGLTAEIRSSEVENESKNERISTCDINGSQSERDSLSMKPMPSTPQKITGKWNKNEARQSDTESLSSTSSTSSLSLSVEDEPCEQKNVGDSLNSAVQCLVDQTKNSEVDSENITGLANIDDSSPFAIEKQEQLLLALLARFQNFSSLQKKIPLLIKNGYLRKEILSSPILKEHKKEHLNLLELPIDINCINERLGNGLFFSSEGFDSSLSHSDVQTSPLTFQSFASNASRFRSDFHNPSLLGKGGFGSVYRVSHKIDEREYAIKRIKFCFKDPTQLKEAYEKVIREVRALSSIEDHTGIVRYHNAWFEPYISDELDPALSEDESQDTENDSTSRSSGRAIVAIPNYAFNSFNSMRHDGIFEMDEDEPSPEILLEADDYFGVKFQEYEESSTSSSPNNFVVGIPESPNDFSFQTRFMEKVSRRKSVQSSDQNVFQNSLVSLKTASTIDQPHIRNILQSAYNDGKFYMILCIQMQLCSTSTLEDWLWSQERREKRIVDIDTIISYMYQIVDAVSHIHEMKIIHRDVKPSNIFLTQDRKLKLGDFGLAKSTLDSVESKKRGLHPMGNHKNNTQHVGTQIYAAPEQISGDDYDEKVDIFSIGVMLFEMFHPFSTGSERIHILSDVRKGIIPADFEHNYCKETEIIRKCTSKNPCDRPNASELHALLNERFGYLSSPSIVNRLLKQKDDTIKEKDDKIRELEEKIRLLESQQLHKHHNP